MHKAPEEFRFAAIAVDIVVFGIKDNTLCLLLDEVNRPPHYQNIDAFIGGLIGVDETADDAVVRHLRDKAGIKNVYTEQLYTFSNINRDKRNRVISVSYMAIVRPDVVERYVHSSAHWTPVAPLLKLAYDHDEMLKVGLARLQGKLGYTTIVQYLLPTEFTLTEMQQVYELVTKKEFDKRNFRKKVLALDIIKETGNVQEGVKNRPAALYVFRNKNVQELQLFV